MKIYLFTLCALLSACSNLRQSEQFSQSYNISETDKVSEHKASTLHNTSEYNNSRLVVIAEICTDIKADNNIIKGTIVGREKVNLFFTGPSEAILIGTTVDNKYIYRGDIKEPDELTYFTVNTPEDGKYLFKRNYTQYKLNQWSSWESPDSFIDDKYKPNEPNNHAFGWLATRYKDRTNELKTLPYNTDSSPKVRFKLMHYEQYHTNKFNQYVRKNMVLKNDLNACQ